MNEVLRGAVAGLAGTAVMPAAMAVAKVAGQQPGGSPPRKVGRKFEEAIGVRDELPQATLEASWVGQHFAYGAVAGVAYALARRRLRLSEPACPPARCSGPRSGRSAPPAGCPRQASLRRRPPIRGAGSGR